MNETTKPRPLTPDELLELGIPEEDAWRWSVDEESNALYEITGSKTVLDQLRPD